MAEEEQEKFDYWKLVRLMIFFVIGFLLANVGYAHIFSKGKQAAADTAATAVMLMNPADSNVSVVYESSEHNKIGGNTEGVTWTKVFEWSLQAIVATVITFLLNLAYKLIVWLCKKAFHLLKKLFEKSELQQRGGPNTNTGERPTENV